ncbi:hypothetical protein [Leptospira dzoumogneensis]|uniref:Uncharacterized protein n=1 Tax=Leptospira dzoumogneensis TaxID=2484904 RepID=A0A4Z1AFK6_9LEPT|nr:hypothetical protein [Leptospira dzoumogneensis]TGN02007.1 hypothetical protein EHR06_06255 [Leptospira dzoumogneensis]
MTNPDGISIKDILFKVGSAVFLGILVLMLIIMLLKPDVEQVGIDMLAGKASITMGSIDDQSVPIDSFNAAKRFCIQMYQGQGSEALWADCAFQSLKGQYIFRKIGNSVGFTITEESERQALWEEAKRVSKNSLQGAGYSEEDLKKPEEIYRQFLQQAPLRFRIDYKVSQSLFQNFLPTEIRRTDGELNIMSEASGARVDLDAVLYTEEDLAKASERNLEPTDVQLKELYDKESLDPNTLKGKDGKPVPFEERKTVLRSKFLLEARKNSLESLKAKLVTLQNEPDGLQKIAALLGRQTVSLKNKSLSDLKKISLGKEVFSLSSDKKFLQDLSLPGLTQKKNIGPFREGEKYAIVSFSGVKLGTPDPSFLRTRENGSLLTAILMEIPQSLEESIKVERASVRSVSEE